MQFIANVNDFFTKARTSWKSLSVHQRTSTLATVFVMLLVPAAMLLAQSPIKLRNQAAATLPGAITPTPTPQAGFSIEGYPYQDINMQISSASSFYNHVALLKFDNKVVLDQKSFSYVWSIGDPSIAEVKITSGLYNDGTGEKCTFEIQLPCPGNYLSIRGLKSGETYVRVRVNDTVLDQEVASQTFTLKVEDTNQTPTNTPTPTFTPTPTSTPTPTPSPTSTPTPPPTETPTPTVTLAPTLSPPSGKGESPSGKTPQPSKPTSPVLVPIKNCAPDGKSVYNQTFNGRCCSGYRNGFSVCITPPKADGAKCSNSNECKSGYCAPKLGYSVCQKANLPSFFDWMFQPPKPAPQVSCRNYSCYVSSSYQCERIKATDGTSMCKWQKTGSYGYAPRYECLARDQYKTGRLTARYCIYK